MLVVMSLLGRSGGQSGREGFVLALALALTTVSTIKERADVCTRM